MPSPHAYRSLLLRQLFIFCISLIACLWLESAQPAYANDAALDRQLITIAEAKFLELGNPNDGVVLHLPHQEVRSPRIFKRFRLEANFSIPDTQAASLWAVYFVSLYDGGRVSVNGTDVGDVQTSTPETTVRHARPYMFHIPPNLLRNGVNRLELEWGARESLTLVSRIFIGPADAITPHYQSRLFWQNSMALAAFVYATVIATMLLSIYCMRRHQLGYLLMSLDSVGWAIVVFVYVLPAMPAFLYPYWRLLHITGIALFTSCAWLFLIRESQSTSRWFPKLCVFWGLLGPSVYLVNFWINDVSFFRSFEGAWGMAAGLLGVYPLYHLARSIKSRPPWRNLIIIFITALAMAMGIADVVLLSTGSSVFGNLGYSVQVFAPVWFTAIAAVLVGDFVTSLTEQDNQRALMVHKLDEQQSQLTQLHEINQMREREKAALQERQRIMQDIHDGLGSQLITSLAMSERGALSKEQTSLLLRECIDDLRLAIDTMTDTDDQFGVAAGNLRFRMEPRLRAAGIVLRWDSTQFTDTASIPATKTLPLLRIMQEAITNALKHAEASEIKVTLSADAQRLLLRISDDGKGFEPSRVRLGKGLSGMEKRARALGAELSISATHGTTISLTLPLADPPSTAQGNTTVDIVL
jgi:signal transduction histidine kinase